MALDIKEIIKIARAQFQELLPELSLEPTDIRLEEIERQGKNWALTFSVPNANYNSVASILAGTGGIRTAKVIVVDELDGKFIALRERAA